MKNSLAVLVAVLAFGVSVGAQHNSPSIVSGPAAQRGWNPSPYRKLFTPALPAPSTAETRAAKPVVKCGMSLIPADPSIDPTFIVPRPDDGVRYSIRSIEPPICK
jgi:hypothetical protein